MTARLDVTPKTTQQNRIIYTSKSEAEVTHNKKLRWRYCIIDATKLTTDRHEAARSLFATAQLLVFAGDFAVDKKGTFYNSPAAHSTVIDDYRASSANRAC